MRAYDGWNTKMGGRRKEKKMAVFQARARRQLAIVRWFGG
jgi:hypothetical protein